MERHMTKNENVKYFNFSNDFENKTGIAVFAAKVTKRSGEKDLITIGYSLVSPNTKLTKQSENIARGKAKKMLGSKKACISIGYAYSGKLSDTVRVVWESAIRPFDKRLPAWALKMSLARNACLLE